MKKRSLHIIFLCVFGSVSCLASAASSKVNCEPVVKQYRQLVEIVQNNDTNALERFFLGFMKGIDEEIPDEIVQKMKAGQSVLKPGALLKCRSQMDWLFRSELGLGLDEVDAGLITADAAGTNSQGKVLVRISYLDHILNSEHFAVENGEIDLSSGSDSAEQRAERRGKRGLVRKLAMSIKRDDWDQFISLLNQGAPLLDKGSDNPLVVAVSVDRPRYTAELVKRGADPNWWMQLGIPIHEYAYRLRAREQLRIMGKHELYEKRLAEDVVKPGGARPAHLVGRWSHGTEMAESMLSLQSNGWCFLAQAVMGGPKCLWNAVGNEVEVYAINPIESAPISTPNYVFVYYEKEDMLVESASGTRYKREAE